jgi:hypothetical protein
MGERARVVKYRAVLNDPGNLDTERPKQILSNSRPDIDDWIKLQLAKAISLDASVTLYETTELRAGLFFKPKPKPEPEPQL